MIHHLSWSTCERGIASCQSPWSPQNCANSDFVDYESGKQKITSCIQDVFPQILINGKVKVEDLYLVGGDWNIWMIFPYIGNFIIPTDEHVFFRGVGQPPTRHDVNPFWHPDKLPPNLPQGLDEPNISRWWNIIIYPDLYGCVWK